ncbi:hypothetical protein ORI20_14030 [Mycobacterium sp. CVI_P3]|uniref:hypothetical protein n=1 Tax=Mycobacterium pinniadriaticum TaxID=2994102 RepID=UPI002248ECB4|nr:hypothetical protein [Mycobacterium pinniadriaticum]MCX2931399.1 hypothetical protein [Mycobacterium pinniadriaticum]
MNDELPIHPTTGLQALGLTKRGRPIWPAMGGSEGEGAGDGGSGEGSGDGDGSGGAGGDSGQGGGDNSGGDGDRGFPANTPIKDMTPEQQAAYWKFHDRRKSDRLNDFDGITPDQAKQWRKDAEDDRLNGLPADQRAMEEARNEATAAATAEADARWAPILAREVVGRFVTDEEQRNIVLAGIDPMKFVKDGTFDTDSLIGHLTGLSAAFGGNGSGGGGNQTPSWGQSGGTPPAQSGKQMGLAEAERRGYIKKD